MPVLMHILDGHFKDTVWPVEILRVDEEGILYRSCHDLSERLVTKSDFEAGWCRFLPEFSFTKPPTDRFAWYHQALGLSDIQAQTSLDLPITSEPTLSLADSCAIRKWAEDRFRVKSSPNVINLKDISFASLLEYTRWEEPQPDSCRQALLNGAIKHLRDRVDAKNRRDHTHVRGADLIQCPPETILEEIKTRYGLTGFSYMCCYAKHLLGPSGEKMIKDVLKHLRSARDAEAIRSLTFEECLELSSNNETLAKLIFICRFQAAQDVGAKKNGQSCEEAFEKILAEFGVARTDYYTEDDLKQIQIELFDKVYCPTPDILFKKQVLLDGRPVRWIDVKNTLVVPGCTMRKRYDLLQDQLEKYSRFSGEGAVMWRVGWAASLPQPKSVRYLQLIEGSGLWQGQASSN